MLTVKDLKKLLKGHSDDTLILLYDGNKDAWGEEANSPLNSFENILPCHIRKITVEGAPMLVKPFQMNTETKEYVYGFINPEAPPEEIKRGKKAILLSPDLLDIHNE